MMHIIYVQIYETPMIECFKKGIAILNRENWWTVEVVEAVGLAL